MPGFTIRQVIAVVRGFLDEMKKREYFFDIVSVDIIDGEWEVECEVVNYPEDDTVAYLIRVDDATGDITHISRQDDDGDDSDDSDDGDDGEDGEDEENDRNDDPGPAPFAPSGGGGWPR
jgi:hypothetical protein